MAAKSSTRKARSSRALWKGAISFGLVHIPVELHSGSRENELNLDLLDKRDFSAIGYQRYNKTTGKPVEWSNIVKGYEYEDGQYVVLTDEDFRRANVEATQTVDIASFVPGDSIPAQYFETPYYLEPTRQGRKVYALLREAMRKSGRIAIATLVIRTRQRLAALIPTDRVLLLNTLRFADEVLPVADLDVPAGGTKAAAISPKELAMAERLISDLADEWKPEDYRDSYREDLMKRVQEKIRSRKTHELTQPSEARPARPSSNVIDLVALLKKSLDSKPARTRGGTGRTRRRA